MGAGELDEGGQKVPTCGYKLISTRDVMYKMINIINTAVSQIKVVKSKSCKFSSQRKIFFFYFFNVSI